MRSLEEGHQTTQPSGWHSTKGTEVTSRPALGGPCRCVPTQAGALLPTRLCSSLAASPVTQQQESICEDWGSLEVGHQAGELLDGLLCHAAAGGQAEDLQRGRAPQDGQ